MNKAEIPTSSYVQLVPDHCDRIVWRNRYYHLPLKQPQAEAVPTQLLQEAKIMLEFLEPHLDQLIDYSATAGERPLNLAQGKVANLAYRIGLALK